MYEGIDCSLFYLQNNLERADYENKTKLGNQIAYLEKECASLRRKLELAADDQKATAQNLQVKHLSIWEFMVSSLK